MQSDVHAASDFEKKIDVEEIESNVYVKEERRWRKFGTFYYRNLL